MAEVNPLNANSEKRAGTFDNCAAICVDDLGIPGVTLADGPITYGELLAALEPYCKLAPASFPPTVSVSNFWRTHPSGKFLLVYKNPIREDGSEGSFHISALVDGAIRNTTPLLLQQRLC